MADGQPYVDDDARAALLSTAIAPLRAQGIDPDNMPYDRSGRPQLQHRPGVDPAQTAPDEYNPAVNSPTVATIAPRPWEQTAPYRNPSLRPITEQAQATPPAAATPASVTQSGTPTGTPSRFEQAQSASLAAQQQAGREYQTGPTPQAELAEEQKLAEKQAADEARLGGLQTLANLRGKQLPQEYRPSVGQRIMRGIQGYAAGGPFGAVLAPYGAPNREYQSDVTGAQGQVAADTTSLAEKRARFKEAQELINARTKAAQEQAKGYGEIAQRETAQEALDNKPPAGDWAGWYAAFKRDNGREPTAAEINQRRIDEVTASRPPREGRQPSELELWSQAFQRDNKRPPTADEIAARRALGTADLNLNKPKGGPDRVQTVDKFESHWNQQFKTIENKYDKERTAVSKDTDLSDSEKQTQYDKIEADRAADKQDVQNRKNDEAEKYGVYNQQPATPSARPTPAVTAPSAPAAPPSTPTPKKAGTVIGPAPAGSKEGRTGKLADGTPVIVKNGKLVVRGQ